MRHRAAQRDVHSDCSSSSLLQRVSSVASAAALPPVLEQCLAGLFRQDFASECLPKRSAREKENRIELAHNVRATPPVPLFSPLFLRINVCTDLSQSFVLCL